MIETSRGCTYDCSFCSIIETRGRNFRHSTSRACWPTSPTRGHGARTIFIVDDNITLDVRRFEALCRAIVEAGLSISITLSRAMTLAIADTRRDARAADAAGGLPLRVPRYRERPSDDLVFRKARAKNARREGGRTIGNASIEAIDASAPSRHVRRGGRYRRQPGRHAGRDRDEPCVRAARTVDRPYIEHPTPYRCTPMTRDFRERVDRRGRGARGDDGTTAVVRTTHVRLTTSSSCGGRRSGG